MKNFSVPLESENPALHWIWGTSSAIPSNRWVLRNGRCAADRAASQVSLGLRPNPNSRGLPVRRFNRIAPQGTLEPKAPADAFPDSTRWIDLDHFDAPTDHRWADRVAKRQRFGGLALLQELTGKQELPATQGPRASSAMQRGAWRKQGLFALSVKLEAPLGRDHSVLTPPKNKDTSRRKSTSRAHSFAPKIS
jgi:hypothetical protein